MPIAGSMLCPFLEDHKEDILCGPVWLASGLDLSGHAGMLSLTSPKLVKGNKHIYWKLRPCSQTKAVSIVTWISDWFRINICFSGGIGDHQDCQTHSSFQVDVNIGMMTIKLICQTSIPNYFGSPLFGNSWSNSYLRSSWHKQFSEMVIMLTVRCEMTPWS